MDIRIYLKERREMIDTYLRTHFENTYSTSVLTDAMKYSLFAGGKRIRPILALAAHEACGGDPNDIFPQAAAIELIHTYSLIHDDLPAMDNDDLRRGKPTNHKLFGEAMAILAGDALLTEAFHMMTINSPKISPILLVEAISDIAVSAGALGMVGGQALDILSENKVPDKEIVALIHINKTAALIKSSVRIGAILAGSTKDKLEALTRYGENLGIAFQIIDDILDIEGTTEELGKFAGSDKNKHKMTYPGAVGLDEAKKKAEDLISSAIDALSVFSNNADPLRGIAIYLLQRRS